MGKPGGGHGDIAGRLARSPPTVAASPPPGELPDPECIVLVRRELVVAAAAAHRERPQFLVSRLVKSNWGDSISDMTSFSAGPRTLKNS